MDDGLTAHLLEGEKKKSRACQVNKCRAALNMKRSRENTAAVRNVGCALKAGECSSASLTHLISKWRRPLCLCRNCFSKLADRIKIFISGLTQLGLQMWKATFGQRSEAKSRRKSRFSPQPPAGAAEALQMVAERQGTSTYSVAPRLFRLIGAVSFNFLIQEKLISAADPFFDSSCANPVTKTKTDKTR